MQGDNLKALLTSNSGASRFDVGSAGSRVESTALSASHLTQNVVPHATSPLQAGTLPDPQYRNLSIAAVPQLEEMLVNQLSDSIGILIKQQFRRKKIKSCFLCF